MGLRSEETLNTFLDKIIENEEIMKLMDLPIINLDDTQAIKNKKITIIKKNITKTIQNPYELGIENKKMQIDGKSYNIYSDYRITITMAQSIKTNSDIFGNPQVDINIYYDNTKCENIFKIVDLISDEFSGKYLKIKFEEDSKEYEMEKLITCVGQTSQTPIINNYERIGIRFSFYASLYKK